MLRIRISGNMLNSPHYDRTREQQKKIRAHNVENRNNSSANNENVNYVGLMDLERLKLSFEKKNRNKIVRDPFVCVSVRWKLSDTCSLQPSISFR